MNAAVEISQQLDITGDTTECDLSLCKLINFD